MANEFDMKEVKKLLHKYEEENKALRELYEQVKVRLDQIKEELEK